MAFALVRHNPAAIHHNTSGLSCSHILSVNILKLHGTCVPTVARQKRSDGRYPCFAWDKDGSCKFGDQCKFSHLGPDDAGLPEGAPSKAADKAPFTHMPILLRPCAHTAHLATGALVYAV